VEFRDLRHYRFMSRGKVSRSGLLVRQPRSSTNESDATRVNAKRFALPENRPRGRAASPYRDWREKNILDLGARP